MWIIQEYYVSFIICRNESFEFDLLVDLEAWIEEETRQLQLRILCDFMRNAYLLGALIIEIVHWFTKRSRLFVVPSTAIEIKNSDSSWIWIEIVDRDINSTHGVLGL
jgi:hypothetical protein